jgi:hypothetical protein
MLHELEAEMLVDGHVGQPHTAFEARVSGILYAVEMLADVRAVNRKAPDVNGTPLTRKRASCGVPSVTSAQPVRVTVFPDMTALSINQQRWRAHAWASIREICDAFEQLCY